MGKEQKKKFEEWFANSGALWASCSKQMVHGVGHMVTTKVEDSGG